jgi:hypothetical protein
VQLIAELALLLAASPNAINASLYDKLSFNFISDIAPVAAISREPLSSGREDSSIRISIEVCRAAPHSKRKSQAMIDSSRSNSEMPKFESVRPSHAVSL